MVDLRRYRTSSHPIVKEDAVAAEKILIVDDSRPFRQSLNRFLAMEGFEVIEAEDGYSGLDQFRSANPALVLLDINMPGIDGFETLRRLREFSHVPVLILSARNAEMDRVLGLTEGADSYLAKPFGAAELLARVHALLRRQRGLQTRRRQRPPDEGLRAPM